MIELSHEVTENAELLLRGFRPGDGEGLTGNEIVAPHLEQNLAPTGNPVPQALQKNTMSTYTFFVRQPSYQKRTF
jgi:hypothetical protein